MDPRRKDNSLFGRSFEVKYAARRRSERSSQVIGFWDFVSIFCALGLVAVVSFQVGELRGIASVLQYDSVESLSGEESIYWESDVDKSSFVDRFKGDRETAWCMYGSVNESGYVVESLEWVGHYGTRSSIEYGCDVSRGFLGGAHSHPSGDLRLSRQDAFSLGSSVGYFEGIVVEGGDGVRVRFFSEDSLYGGFDEVEVAG